MKVIDAVANKLKSPALLMGFSKLMDAAADCFVTSLSQEQISALVRMQLGDLANWDIQSYTVTGSGAKSTKCYSAKGQSLYVMKPDENSVNEAKASSPQSWAARTSSPAPARPPRRPMSSRRPPTPTPVHPSRRNLPTA